MNENETYVMYIKDYNLFGSRQPNGSVSIMTILYASLLRKVLQHYENIRKKRKSVSKVNLVHNKVY